MNRGARIAWIVPDLKPGGIGYAEFAIGDRTVMLSDEYPDYGSLAPELGQAGSFMIYVADVEESFVRAINAGVTVIMPPTDQFYGDRAAKVADGVCVSCGDRKGRCRTLQPDGKALPQEPFGFASPIRNFRF